jgi:galactose mutarotase-like enzyme
MTDEAHEEACSLTCDGSTVVVRPDRGAIVSGLKVHGIDGLYLEEATLDSPSGAVRGGVPILFPFAGELLNGCLLASGTEMPRHGFARRKAWQVIARTASEITMRLAPDEDIRSQFPFEFVVSQVVTATPRGLRIDLHVENHDVRSFPIAPGWHPYFPCPAWEKLACLSQVLRTNDLSSFEPVACDVNLAASADRRVDFGVPGIGPVSLTFSENVKTIQVWTPPEANFVCVEPWVGPTNTINTPGRINVAPGDRVLLSMAIELVDPGPRRST